MSEKSTENTKQAAEMASKAAEKATLEAKMRTEQLKRGSEKISNMFGNMREKVEERASEEYEKSEYAKKKIEDIKAAQEGVGTFVFFGNEFVFLNCLALPSKYLYRCQYLTYMKLCLLDTLFFFFTFFLHFFFTTQHKHKQQKHHGLHRFVMLCKKHS